MKKGIALILASAWLGDVTLAQYQQDTRSPSDSRVEVRTQKVHLSQAQLQRLSKLIGTEVRDQRGQELGEIRDFAIDPRRDQVTFAILSADGRTIPVPWQALDISADANADLQPRFVSLHIDRDRLRNAPTMRSNNAMMLADEQFTMQVHRHFGTQPVSLHLNSPDASADVHLRDRDRTDIRYRDDDMRDSRFEYDSDRPRNDSPWRDTSVDPQRSGFDMDDDDDAFDRDVEFRYDDDRDRVNVDVDDDDDMHWNDRDRVRIDADDAELRVYDDRDDDLDVRVRDRDRNRTIYHDRDGRVYYDEEGVVTAPPDDANQGGYGGGIWGQEEDGARITIRDRDVDRIVVRDRGSTATSSRTVFLASDLLDADAKDVRGNTIGDVEDVLVSTQTGHVAFVVLPGESRELHAVPLQVVEFRTVDRDQPELMVRMDENRLRSAPSFSDDQWRMIITDNRLINDTYAFFNVQEPGFVYGFAEPQSDDRFRDRDRDTFDRDRNMQRDRNPQRQRDAISGNMDADSVVSNWPRASQRAAREMMQRYGQPDGVTQDAIYWLDNGDWAHTIVYRQEVQHAFPMEHSDVLEQAVYYQVPVDRFDDVARFDGSVVCDRTKGLMIARCDSEAMNIAALNLAYEVASGRRSVDEARQMLADTAMRYRQGESTSLTQQLQFRPESPSQAGDPDQPLNRDRSDRSRFDRDANTDRRD